MYKITYFRTKNVKDTLFGDAVKITKLGKKFKQ